MHEKGHTSGSAVTLHLDAALHRRLLGRDLLAGLSIEPEWLPWLFGKTNVFDRLVESGKQVTLERLDAAFGDHRVSTALEHQLDSIQPALSLLKKLPVLTPYAKHPRATSAAWVSGWDYRASSLFAVFTPAPETTRAFGWLEKLTEGRCADFVKHHLGCLLEKAESSAGTCLVLTQEPGPLPSLAKASGIRSATARCWREAGLEKVAATIETRSFT